MRITPELAAGLMILSLLAGRLLADKKPKREEVRIGAASYQIPTTWKRERPRSRMRVAQYSVPMAKGDERKVEFLVFYFGGQGGSVEANLKRWIDMFQDKEGKEKIEKFEVAGMKVTTLDIAGTYKERPAPFVPKVTLRKSYRMLTAVVETPNQGPYFFRMVGPKKSIAAQVDSWKHLLKTAEKN